MSNEIMSTSLEEKFAVLSEVKEYDKPLYLIDLTFARLIDDVVFPYEVDELFFVDGYRISKDKLMKLKIIQQNDQFTSAFWDLHTGMSRFSEKLQQIYASQYDIRSQAVMRQDGEDVTSQIIKAFDAEIRPKLKDYIPKRNVLIEAAAKFFWEGVKALGAST